MEFDIHQLDRFAPGDAGAEEAYCEYEGTLLRRFCESCEGQKYLKDCPEDVSLWSGPFMYYGYHYLGVTVPQMTANSAKQIMMEVLPRKMSFFSPDELDSAVPEMIAFWEYLKREYTLPEADKILEFLLGIGPDFKASMMDPSRWGLAKSIFMLGQSLGFDMTKQEDVNDFILLYNSFLASQREASSETPAPPRPSTRRPAKAKKKKPRKVTQAARSKGRKGRK